MDKLMYAALLVLLFACGIANTQKQEKITATQENKKIDLVNGEFQDSRDGINYLTITYPAIAQTWFVENCVYFKDSTVKRFNKFSGTNQDEDYMTAKPYDQESPNVGMNTYDPYKYRDAGLYYDFYSAQIACPNGYHLANRNDWKKFMQQFQNQDKYYADGVNYLGMVPSEAEFGLSANPLSKFDVSDNITQLYWIGMSEDEIKKLTPGKTIAIKITIKKDFNKIHVEEVLADISSNYYPCRCIKD